MIKNKKLTAVLVVLAVSVIALIVVADIFLSRQTVQKTDYAMGAVITQTITGKNASETAEEIIDAIDESEKMLSWRIGGSVIDSLNKNKKQEVSVEMQKIFEEVLQFCKKSDGAVDPTIGVLTRLWNIGTENFRVPEKTEIKNILKKVSYESIEIKNSTVRIGENQLVDLGFVGKGIACDRAKKILNENNVDEAIINVGGSLCLHGDGTYTVGIRNPLGEVNDYFAVIKTKEAFLSTSGNYERFSEHDGKKYHHILSTETGYPVENDLLSVTVVCNSGLLSDALSTAVYCMGYERGLELLKEYNAEAVFIFNDKSIKITDALKDKIEIKNNEFKLWKEN